ncbi:mannose-1-phosphate guanylyltransferase [Aurantiacibacter rhizosphaerae]|uniref:NTP transferase domain-containing protein n=1 Tax=Aurantiacibacter rhizosphaerae TaxID=2691582 RepID=A0A844XB32_9SPHN|nr:sugar phosphate nucleotidyltransferase [Aurantiacibacter rhizosphaerae]MWV26989.1 NTP transferase domain-containing protein [Aurantiacibacter rhizosphaerae]
MSKIVPVIMCGGSGTRLWPRSRKTKPKPFLPLVGDQTLFEATLARCSDETMFASPIVVAGDAHVPHIRESLPSGGTIIVEPGARNTAPAIALAAARLPAEAVMLVCPSDHHIRDSEAFRRAVIDAAALAESRHLVAIGITPTAPETGFGYIERGEPLPVGYRVRRFVEKPDLERATVFLADGNFAWNGGIFVFRAGTYLEELGAHRPDIAGLVRQAVTEGKTEEDLFHPAAEPFCRIDGESIDFAVMEKTGRAATVMADMGWSDIGNWKALFNEQECGEAGNAVRGRADLVDCENVFVDSDGPRVSVIGLSNVVVVVDGNEVLVTCCDSVQNVGKLQGALQQ